MASEFDEVWDEFQWERFLQQQDRKTERYLELLEKYIDHPKRDQLIAQEMGWSLAEETELSDEDLVEAVGDWAALAAGAEAGPDDDEPDEEDEDSAENDSAEEMEEDGDEADDEEDDVDDEEDEEEDEEEDDDDDDDDDDEAFSFQDNPVYQESFSLTLWIDDLLDLHPEYGESNAFVQVTSHAALCSSKLAAALSDDGVDELGMTIAYLKRALWAINSCLDGVRQLREKSVGEPAMHDALQAKIFGVRNGIVSMVGDCRAEWRRRFSDS